MLVDAVIPVKAAVAGKERLARLLAPEERARLVRAMLRDVAGALVVSGRLRTVAVTSPDAEMLALAQELGALPLPEPPGTHGLNAALTAAIEQIAARGAEGVLVVQGDVPAVRPSDVAVLLSPLPDAPCVRAVPSADGGTSALLLSPPGVIAPAFGVDSFARHADAARAAGVPFERRDLPALAADIDRPEDIARLLDGSEAPYTRAELLRAAIPERLARMRAAH